MISQKHGCSNAIVLFAVSILLAAHAGCSSKPAPVMNPEPMTRVANSNITDAKRLSDGPNKLLDAMKKPATSFRFSFKGQENLNDRYPRDKHQAPRLGPVSLRADISPEEISLIETRGQTTRESKAKRSDDMGWAMANLSTLGVMTSPDFAIALGSSVTSPPTTDLVGATPADKFTFDTTAATPAQRRGLEAARVVLTTIRECKGTAWIARDSGLLIKFNIDVDYQDQNDHAWKEHYEGEVTPKE